ncbi:MAG: hypothetical protein DRG20_04555 [Deltaproteobacteria bacterium]|nr:MAG: hypothetical protein DRG20_04555 [Deltaproteobacteria bacterium]
MEKKKKFGIEKESFLKFLAIIKEILYEFINDRCLMVAASLAFVTLLSLVPITVISLSFLSRFKFSQENFQDLIFQYLLPSGPVQNIIKQFINTFAQNTTTLSIFGGLVLAFVAVSLLNIVEEVFNNIWGVKGKRRLISKFTSFWSILTFGPLLLAVSFMITGMVAKLPFIGSVMKIPIVDNLLKHSLPFLLIATAIFFMYRLLPYSHVKFLPAAFGAALAAMLFMIARTGFRIYVIHYAHLDRIYGMLGVIPMFLIWLYFSWALVLFGAEIAYTLQHYQPMDMSKKEPIDLSSRNLDAYYGIRVVLEIAQNFLAGNPPLLIYQLAERWDVDPEKIKSLAEKLKEEDIISTANGSPEKYLPARNPETITIEEIVKTVYGNLFEVAEVPEDKIQEVIRSMFDKTQKEMKENFGNETIKSLLEKIEQ